MYATAWAADKYRIRGPIIMGNAVVTIMGLAMMAFVKCELVSGQAAPARRSGCWRAEE
jgi:hypothetical protein